MYRMDRMAGGSNFRRAAPDMEWPHPESALVATLRRLAVPFLDVLAPGETDNARFQRKPSKRCDAQGSNERTICTSSPFPA
jgi:hypothetical protein